MLIPHVRLTLQAEHASFLARPCKRHSEWSLEIVTMNHEAQKTQNEFFCKTPDKTLISSFWISHFSQTFTRGPPLTFGSLGTSSRNSVSVRRCVWYSLQLKLRGLEEIKSMLLKRVFTKRRKKNILGQWEAHRGHLFWFTMTRGPPDNMSTDLKTMKYLGISHHRAKRTNFFCETEMFETADRSDGRLKSARGRQESNGWPGKLSHDPLLEPP